jgi:predicted pyridoxine 5'-phosphate oxidase superfamily flavin-nucleotide-binding protein
MDNRTPSRPAGWDLDSEPFHSGELEVQTRAGVRDFAAQSGRLSVRRYMPEQHRKFYEEQPFIVLGGLDEDGQPWATLRTGEPGFVSTPDAQTLRIAARALPGDPLDGAWKPGSWLGALGLQPATRRRNRVNGVVTALDSDSMTVQVSQSFGNCPRYIQSRTPTAIAREVTQFPRPRISATLTAADRVLVERSDTLFIASRSSGEGEQAAQGVDVSHRGGMPGFVHIDDERTFTLPDYNGNRFFNTLGNLAQDPRAGVMFIDYENGDLLHVTARVEVIWEGPEVEAIPRAERLVRFHVEEVRRRLGVVPFQWSDVQYSPQFKPAAVAS